MSERLKVRVKRVEGADDLPLPAYQSEHASGLDLLAAVEDELAVKPGGWALVPTGVSVEIPPGFEGQVRPRSGLALRHGVSLVNTPGTVDADYRGEIRVIMINFGPEPFVVRRGDRIAQMVFSKVYRAELVESDELSGTGRGDGGFGHTGHR